MRFFPAFWLITLPVFSTGFTPTSSVASRRGRVQHLVPEPDHLDFLTHAVNAIDSTAQHSHLIAEAADAVDATAVTAVEAAKDGWWQQYLSIFKNTLIFVHSTIDEPLRNVGITQTWGVSIAVFTACEFGKL